MPRKYSSLVALCALSLVTATGCAKRLLIKEIQPDEIETTVFLIGDAGEPDPRHSSLVLDSMMRQAAVAPARSIIVFLGDNVYPNGIPRDSSVDWQDSRRRLQSQVNAVPPGARGIFLPGNHDWAAATAFGLYSVRLQERMIASLARGRDIRMLPGNGCPGPVAVDTGRLRLIALDTQWWLHDFIVRDSESACITTVGGVTAALRALVQEKREGRVTVAAGHHPLMTGGEHGGYCGFTGPFRRLGGQSQDILSSLNRAMRDSLESAFRAHPPIAYAAGHDHNLQVMKGAPAVQYLLVSGAGSQAKASCAVYLRESYYVSQHRSGFMRIDVLKGKGVLLSVFDYTGAGVPGQSFSRWLEPR
ncbi:MAG: hypothetical protein ABI681_04545 [Gemmatimonadales bacterium]